MKANQVKNIILDVPATSGYIWELISSPEYFDVINKKMKSASKKSFGGQAQQVFKIRALKDGPITITAVMKRPWEQKIYKTQNINLDEL